MKCMSSPGRYSSFRKESTQDVRFNQYMKTIQHVTTAKALGKSITISEGQVQQCIKELPVKQNKSKLQIPK